MVDTLLKLVNVFGIPLSLVIVSVGAVAYYCGRRLLPWVGHRIDCFCEWIHPYAGRFLEAKLKKLERDDHIETSRVETRPDVCANEEARGY